MVKLWLEALQPEFRAHVCNHQPLHRGDGGVPALPHPLHQGHGLWPRPFNSWYPISFIQLQNARIWCYEISTKHQTTVVNRPLKSQLRGDFPTWMSRTEIGQLTTRHIASSLYLCEPLWSVWDNGTWAEVMHTTSGTDPWEPPTAVLQALAPSARRQQPWNPCLQNARAMKRKELGLLTATWRRAFHDQKHLNFIYVRDKLEVCEDIENKRCIY